MRKKRFLFLLIIGIANLCIIHESHGHSVYFEETAGGIVVRFGEFQGDHEESPGYLDQLDAVTAWIQNKGEKPKALITTKKKQGFSLEASLSASILAQTGFPVMARGDNPGRKPNFYARWISGFDAKIEPAMNLDIVPTGKADQAQVFFRGKPLADVEVKLYSPDAEEEKYTSDKKGIINFKINPKATGIYMLKVARYSEELKGFDRGVGYAVTSHNCSLTRKQK